MSVRAFELVGDIDDQHELHARVPETLPSGPVRVIVLLPDEDAGGTTWAKGISREWAGDLADAEQDIYSLDDGYPVNATK